MTYSEKLKDPRWQKKRLKILERDKWTCVLCKDTETTLHVHHIEYTEKNAWDEPNKNLVTLCEHCHIEVESLKQDGILFNDIKVHKSNNWKGGSRIMFISFDYKVLMVVYDDENNYLCGYNLQGDDLNKIKRIISISIKNGNTFH